MLRQQSLLILGVVLLCSCQAQERSFSRSPQDKGAGIHLSSTAFSNGGTIPAVYSCDGKKISPQLAWSGVPARAVTLALLCEDPDAPSGTFTHWMLFNLPPTTTGLPQAVPNRLALENGAQQGKNDFGEIGYGAPCPPRGTHRYYFRLYAMDTRLRLQSGVTRQEFLGAIKGHVLAQGELMGKYTR